MKNEVEEEKLDATQENLKSLISRRETVEVEQGKRQRILPRKDWVLIQVEEAKDKKYGSIVLTEGQVKGNIGRVVAVANNVTDLQRGDLVVFTNYPLDLPELEDATGDRNIKLVREEEVYGVLVDEE